ncbi:hypothetical protein [Akkermansia muciniphila]|uniref:hypothetical protein n=1 Tax=Akkermansia muciniphila TaxID=239935 RepID=UPI0027D2010C|nr:hypothetical protein [Akkermansia muciniphila]MCI9266193.1 hypothetical protein [Akkermansia muciniphila]WMB17458.1 hypothetical protein O4G21_11240 [Akkermansia muciniphila]
MNQAFTSRCFSQMPLLLLFSSITAFTTLHAKGQQVYEGKTTLEQTLAPVEVVNDLSQLAAKLKQCCAGELKIPNTTKVTDPKSPSTIPYNGKISLKDFKDERISQPTTVAWLSLISDDGCDIAYTTGDGEKIDWLKEHGKGHDISKGRRDCPHVLKADSYNFQIKYSQTYYNPKPGTSDLDGISLVVAPIVVDICIGEKSIPYSKSHLFLEKKTELRLAINKIYLAKGPSENSEDISITWEAQTYSKCPQRFNGVILACNHTFQPNNGAWKPIGKGPCITYTPTEVELIRVTIGDKSFYYEGIPNHLGEVYWAIRPCQGMALANHHFLFFVPDDPKKFNLPNPGLADCNVIPGMKIITLGGDAGTEIKYKKRTKGNFVLGAYVYTTVIEPVPPPYKKAGVTDRYIECLTDMSYHKNDAPDILAVENWYKNQHEQKFTNFTDLQIQENKAYFQQVLHFSQSYDEKERYNLLPKSYPNLDEKSPYYGSNCASFVASILRYTGATLEQITQAADAQGIDVGEKRLVPRNRFNP